MNFQKYFYPFLLFILTKIVHSLISLLFFTAKKQLFITFFTIISKRNSILFFYYWHKKNIRLTNCIGSNILVAIIKNNPILFSLLFYIKEINFLSSKNFWNNSFVYRWIHSVFAEKPFSACSSITLYVTLLISFKEPLHGVVGERE